MEEANVPSPLQELCFWIIPNKSIRVWFMSYFCAATIDLLMIFFVEAIKINFNNNSKLSKQKGSGDVLQR